MNLIKPKKLKRGDTIAIIATSGNVNIEKIKYIIELHEEKLKNIPIICNANFGHTQPIFTFPIGGKANIISEDNENLIKFYNS